MNMRLKLNLTCLVGLAIIIISCSFTFNTSNTFVSRPRVTSLFNTGSSRQRQYSVSSPNLHPYSTNRDQASSIDNGLLSFEEEITLARLVQQRITWEEIRFKLAMKLKREPTLSEWSMQCGRHWIKDEEFVFALHKSEEAKAALINGNLRLVVKLAKKHKAQCRTRLQLSDLIHEGIFGLLRASEKFDPERGYRFSTIATWWIRQAISRAVANHDRLVRLPVHVQETLQNVRRVQRELSAQLGRECTEGELASNLGITIDRLHWLCSCVAKEPISLNSKFSSVSKYSDGEREQNVEYYLTDNDLNPEEYLTKVSISDHLEDLLLRLHPRERIVVRLRYGLDNGGTVENFSQIGSEVGVKKERARQIEMKAMERLKMIGGSASAIRDAAQSYLV